MHKCESSYDKLFLENLRLGNMIISKIFFESSKEGFWNSHFNFGNVTRFKTVFFKFIFNYGKVTRVMKFYESIHMTWVTHWNTQLFLLFDLTHCMLFTPIIFYFLLSLCVISQVYIKTFTVIFLRMKFYLEFIFLKNSKHPMRGIIKVLMYLVNYSRKKIYLKIWC